VLKDGFSVGTGGGRRVLHFKSKEGLVYLSQSEGRLLRTVTRQLLQRVAAAATGGRFVVTVDVDGGQRAFALPSRDDFGALLVGLNSLLQIAAGRANDYTFLRDMQWHPTVALDASW